MFGKLRDKEIMNILKERIKSDSVAKTLTAQILRGAEGGLEFEKQSENWLDRLKYHFVWLDRDDYSRALVRALWLAPTFAGTDFGSSRQRDMGQVWTDTARGFLGEIALSKFLKNKFGVEVYVDTRRGELEEFLPTDIAEVVLPNSERRRPNIKISIKTTKFNGRWLDAPGAQYEHSDAFVLVRIGILRHHFLAFLKAISFLKDKLFVTAKNLGELDEKAAGQLWDEIPQFDPIPAYIVGFIFKAEVKFPIEMIKAKLTGRKTKRIVVTQGTGLFSPETIRSNTQILKLDPSGTLPIEIEPIIDSLDSPHFLSHSGGLKYGEESWKSLVTRL